MADAVRDVMSKDLTSVEPGDSVADAASKMAQSDIGVVLVLDGDELKGLLTDRDVVVRVVAEGKEADDVKVEEIVTAEVRTLEPDASVDDALRTMREAKVRRLPV